jgi:hypothetical protein
MDLAWCFYGQIDPLSSLGKGKDFLQGVKEKKPP